MPKLLKNSIENVSKKLAETKTVLLVSHQLSYIEECDEILIFEAGKVKAKGTPGEVSR